MERAVLDKNQMIQGLEVNYLIDCKLLALFLHIFVYF